MLFRRPGGRVSKSQMGTDQELLTELYTTYGARVYSRCLYLLKDKAEAQDALHDVFIKVQKNLDGFRGDASPITWMTRIATNHCLNIIRGKKAAWHERYKKEVELQPHAEAPTSLRENQQLLSRCLARTAAVDPQLAELAVLYFVDGMTQHQVCAAAGLSAPTLRKRLREFIALCRDEISQAVPGVVFEEAPI
jgi:RNA polymerase sigma-70 factor, ECF subfamily